MATQLVGDLPDERDLVLEPSRCRHDVLTSQAGTGPRLGWSPHSLAEHPTRKPSTDTSAARPLHWPWFARSRRASDIRSDGLGRLLAGALRMPLKALATTYSASSTRIRALGTMSAANRVGSSDTDSHVKWRASAGVECAIGNGDTTAHADRATEAASGVTTVKLSRPSHSSAASNPHPCTAFAPPARAQTETCASSTLDIPTVPTSSTRLP